MILALQGIAAPAAADISRTGTCATAMRELTRASSGLLMPSESDVPFTPFTWAGAAKRRLTTARVLELTGHAPGTTVEVVELEHFFRNVAYHQPWHDPQQTRDVRRFRRLMKVLDRHLDDIRVYRIGTIEIDAYIVGRCGGRFAGLSTTLIET